MTIPSAPWCVGLSQHPELNPKTASVEDSDSIPYLEDIENIADSDSPPPSRQKQTLIYSGAAALLIDYIAEPWERDTLGCLEMNLQNIPYYPLATREKSKYIHCGIKKKGMKTNSDNVLKEENNALYFSMLKNGDRVQKFVASMPEDHGLKQWELHTLEEIRWNDNQHSPIKYLSLDITKRMRWLIQ